MQTMCLITHFMENTFVRFINQVLLSALIHRKKTIFIHSFKKCIDLFNLVSFKETTPSGQSISKTRDYES